MSGARPKVYAGRSSSSSSDNHEDTATPDTAALCRLYGLDPGELAISSRDAHADQDGLQLSLQARQGTVQSINYTGHVEGKDNVQLQLGDNNELTIASPLIQHVTVVTYADGTEVTRTYDDGEEVPQNQAHPAAIDGLDDLASLANIPARRPHTNVRGPKIPSAEQLDWLKRYLKRLYRTKLGEFQPLPWFDDLHLHLKDVYTNLQVARKDRADRDLPLRRSGRGQTGRGQTGNMSSNSARDSRKGPGLIRIEQIFDVDRNGEVPRVEDHGEFEEEEENEKPKRIRIEGPPGIGKSIQCRKLACDWSSGSFQQFDFAFLLQMRYFSGDVKDAIFDQLLPEDTEMDREALWSYIRQGTNQPKVLFILDGLDELKPQVRQTSDVIKLIQQRVLTDATVVITSRPNECTADLKGCPLHCNITGYTMTNSNEYIHKYFNGRPELANSLGARIARDKDLAELATNPLNTMLLCIIWEDNDGSLPSTITSLFSSLVLCIVKRYCKKTHDITVTGTTIPDNIDTQLAEMGKVAWKGLLRNEVNFDEADFQATDRGMEMFRFGFLTKDLGASRIDASFVWSFLHKTFQEYFAAVFLSKDAAMQEDFGGSAPLGLFEFTPRPLSLVEPHVPRQQENVSGPTFKDRVLHLLNNDSLHQVFLFLVGILKQNARPVFECFRRHLQVLRSSDDDAAQNRYKALFRFFIKCLIESENGSDLVRGLPYCFPKAIDVSDLFAHVYDDTWSSALIFMLDAQCQWVTRVDINLSTHEMDKELAAAFIRNRFLKHLSITNLFLDDVIAPSADAEQEDFPLFEVLKRSQSTLEFFVRIQGITTSDRDVALMRRLFHAMSQSTQLSSAILKLDMKRTNRTGKLCLPVDLLSPLSTLTTVKLWLYGTFRHHAITDVYYEVGESNKGGGRYGEIDDNFEYYDGQSVDDQAFNESIEKLLRESKSIQTFSLQIMYRCIVFEHAKNLPSALASVISDTGVLRNIVLHFSFYHEQRDLKHPLTYSELTRLDVFGLVEALSHNRTLQTFELFIDDDGLSRNGEDTLSGMEEDVAHEATSSSYNNQIQSSRVNASTETDQVRLWPSIVSVFQNNTVLYRLKLTFKYCLTDRSESVQRMADALLALSGNRTLRTVKLHVILYRAQTNGHLGMSNVDKVFHALGKVVSTNTTLKYLHFHKTDDPWRRACRVRSCTKLSQSDESWHVTVSKPAIEQLASATQRNMVLREFSVMGFSCEDEGVQEVIDEMVSSARDSLNITFSIS